ncbi:MAG TPA: hypothetical protein VHY79_05555 [Rhizomicrobium sp.]|nr:hypothetical protein [Rhizomicrobium sp.]
MAFMATLAHLEADGRVLKYDAALEDDEQELRLLYVSPTLAEWIGTTLPTLISDLNDPLPPLDQFDAYGHVYASGLPLVFDRQFKVFQPRAVEPLGDGVWYIKTTDIRIFGWFWRRDVFVGVVGDTAYRCKTYNLYQGYRSVNVARFRDDLPLDEPKFIPGTNPDDVLSNYDLP